MAIRTVNSRAKGTHAKPGETVVSIDRSTPLGNPYQMRLERDRDSVIAMYRLWLIRNHIDNPVVAAELNRIVSLVECGHDVALQCWCAPKACHGDIIIECVKVLLSERGFTDTN